MAWIARAACVGSSSSPWAHVGIGEFGGKGEIGDEIGDFGEDGELAGFGLIGLFGSAGLVDLTDFVGSS